MSAVESEIATLGFAASCPLPDTAGPQVQLGHGGGGAMSRTLVEEVILPAFGNARGIVAGLPLHDGAVLEAPGARLAFTSDGYVVRPHRFAGGDIGDLAVNGTVNDLSMCGATARWLSVGFIIEEGFAIAELESIARSMGTAASRAGVTLVTGDTKVVERGAADGLFVTTSGVGTVADDIVVGPDRIAEGDVVIVSGDVGRHGVAVLSARAGFDFESSVMSDSAPLGSAVKALFDAGIDVHCLRDATRGGLATSLIELADAAALGIRLDEAAVPVDDGVRGAAEMLGLDPLYIANEGRFVAFVPQSHAERALAALRQEPVAVDACIIGHVTGNDAGRVIAETAIGGTRALEMQSGEQLPRIC